MSHNKFSFITKKTFPSNQWVPYRLQEIDLSYNELPILSYDLAFGTHKVIKMNISHNQITEVRRSKQIILNFPFLCYLSLISISDVIANWTRLEVLDLSYNELTDLLSGETELTVPENVTKLYLAGNHLLEFPVKILSNISILKEIDLRNNQIKNFDKNLLTNVRNGMNLLIQGNPVECDCRVRPLKHYLDMLLDTPENFVDIVCRKPSILSEKRLIDVSDDNLNCIYQNGTSNEKSFEVFPDLTFRDIF